MKKAMISFLLLFVATAMSAQTVKGDMNGDDELTVTDVTLLVDAILGNTPDLDMKFLSTLGPVQKLSLEEIFGY